MGDMQQPVVISREAMNAYLTDACGKGVPHFEQAETLEQALHGLAYIQRQILSTNTYRPHIGQCNAAVSSLQWALDYFARDHLTRPEAPQEGWREVLRMLIAADEEAKPNGVMDCVDNDGHPYQSAYMAGIITHARMLADPHPALSKGEGVTDELKGEDRG